MQTQLMGFILSQNINYKIKKLYNNLPSTIKILSFFIFPLTLIICYFTFLKPYNTDITKALSCELLQTEQKLHKLQKIKSQNVFEITHKVKKFAEENEVKINSSVFENNILACEFEAEFEKILKLIKFIEQNHITIGYFYIKESKNNNISLQMKVILQ